MGFGCHGDVCFHPEALEARVLREDSVFLRVLP